MTFLAPWNLLWMALLAPLTLLYVLKRRREERLIGSTLLWEQTLLDLRAEKPWRRLTPQVSLLLQACVIVAGSVALARPTGGAAIPRGAHIAAVVDLSASMDATDSSGRSRVEHAQGVLRSVVARLPQGGRLMIVEAGAAPGVLAPLTDDAVTLQRAIDALRARGGSASLDRAVALASERLRDAPSGSRVIVLTDGSSDEALELPESAVPVELQRVRGRGDRSNVGIVDASVRARGGRTDRAEAFARISNDADRAIDVYVTARAVGREGLLASRRLTIAPGAAEAVVLPVELPPDASGRAAVLVLELDAGPDDALSLDDRVVLPSPGARRLPVYLVGQTPRSVERVFRADPDTELFATSLDALARRDADAPALDGLMVFAGRTPEQPPPGDSLVIAPTGERAFEMPLLPVDPRPTVVTWEEGDPRLRFVPFADVVLSDVRHVTAGIGEALVSTTGGAAIVALSRPSGETLLVGFDPDRSDWPRSPGFVVFFRNVMERVRAHRAAGGVAAGALGEALRVPAPEVEEVVVTTPLGAELRATSRAGLAIVPIDAVPGVYTVQVGRRRLHALRNLLDRSESDTRDRLAAARTHGATNAGVVEVGAEHREAWTWVAAAMLLLLGAEILWATRRHAV